ncbi:NnrU family protein [Maritalea mediterranea]|uniref:NnrU family protein n=1 Tax=Maritalea mediterranea TaxID=2909667 RepID=A0ABS9E5D8_9HYPH|nr:NnrU family protein [Maritalea mediterranea]MCF4098066.1 NnrU family protein [Maritalea mediterranea]
MVWLILGLVLFLGVHSARMLVPDFREKFIAKHGEMMWKGLYAIESLIGLALIIWGYGQARMDPVILYETPYFFRHIAHLLMLVAFIVLAAAYVPAGKIKAATKHPMILSVKIWASAHLLVNGDLASLILFLSFLAWAVWNRINVKRRGEPTPDAGPVTNDMIAVVIGGVAFVIFAFWGHGTLIGVPLF